MRCEEFVKLVREMRGAQTEYFRRRTNDALAKAKRLERQVDAAQITCYDIAQPSLFEAVNALPASETKVHSEKTPRQPGEGGRAPSCPTDRKSPTTKLRRESLSKVRIPTVDEIWSAARGGLK